MIIAMSLFNKTFITNWLLALEICFAIPSNPKIQRFNPLNLFSGFSSALFNRPHSPIRISDAYFAYLSRSIHLHVRRAGARRSGVVIRGAGVRLPRELALRPAPVRHHVRPGASVYRQQPRQGEGRREDGGLGRAVEDDRVPRP